jgi:hypothetical protein
MGFVEVRIVRRPGVVVDPDPTERELHGVCLADQHHPRRSRPGDDERVPFGAVIGPQMGARSGVLAGHVEKVFNRIGHPVQRPAKPTHEDIALRQSGFLPSPLLGQSSECVQPPVEFTDPLEHRVEHLDRRHLEARDPLPQLLRRQISKVHRPTVTERV